MLGTLNSDGSQPCVVVGLEEEIADSRAGIDHNGENLFSRFIIDLKIDSGNI